MTEPGCGPVLSTVYFHSSHTESPLRRRLGVYYFDTVNEGHLRDVLITGAPPTLCLFMATSYGDAATENRYTEFSKTESTGGGSYDTLTCPPGSYQDNGFIFRDLSLGKTLSDGDARAAIPYLDPEIEMPLERVDFSSYEGISHHYKDGHYFRPATQLNVTESLTYPYAYLLDSPSLCSVPSVIVNSV